MSISSTHNGTALGDLKNKFASALKNTAESWSTYRRKRKAYTNTFAELAGLSARDLADLGFSRGDIRRVAREAAEMA
ncbi:DUF1127 domain-containing protein [Neptunicoccus sediminis]|uniref:DUF1127 domain-containing protein n=1 Tax=Neptunicoccus sediminis TaxID=1892596 RepID=UPI000845FE9F|nr:DUF1127 domain-containing protein [Neptunicoccus sediminis]